MNPEEFNDQAGTVSQSPKGLYHTFTPKKMPSKINLSSKTLKKLEDATYALGNLNGVGHSIINPHLLIRPYLKKEAVWSSKIEGTRTSLSDVFLYEAKVDAPAGEGKDTDLQEVINYINSTEYGLKEIKTKNLDHNLILEIHKILLSGVRGASKDPGKIRINQNWIGPYGSSILEATFVPPAPEKLDELLEDLFTFLNDKNELPDLLKIGLAHYQFEATHPFRDGNGRIGRLLITLYLCKKQKLGLPLLYISGYFEQNRSQYYDLLLNVSKKGDYESWLNFFLDAVITQSNDATQRILKLEDYSKIAKAKIMQKRNMLALKILDQLFINPFINIPFAERILGKRYPTAKRAVMALVNEGILQDACIKDGKTKIFVAPEINAILS